MLTNDEIRAFLENIEADNVERTVSTSKTDKFCQAICAFANDMPGHGTPGYLFIGADDKTGKIAGIEITDQLLQNLASHRDSGQIVPLPSLTVQKRSFPDQNDYRNPKIAEAMKVLKYVNQFRRGIRRAQALLQKNGNPAAEFTIDQPNYFLATVQEAGL